MAALGLVVAAVLGYVAVAGATHGVLIIRWPDLPEDRAYGADESSLGRVLCSAIWPLSLLLFGLGYVWTTSAKLTLNATKPRALPEAKVVSRD